MPLSAWVWLIVTTLSGQVASSASTEEHRMYIYFISSNVVRRTSRGVDPYGTGGTRPPIFGLGGHDHECAPQYF